MFPLFLFLLSPHLTFPGEPIVLLATLSERSEQKKPFLTRSIDSVPPLVSLSFNPYDAGVQYAT
jgi:hypothetical protein